MELGGITNGGFGRIRQMLRTRNESTTKLTI